MESVSPTIKRNDPDTWYPACADKNDDTVCNCTVRTKKKGLCRCAPDPWPHSGWKAFADMVQGYGAGWLFVALREML